MVVTFLFIRSNVSPNNENHDNGFVKETTTNGDNTNERMYRNEQPDVITSITVLRFFL